MVHTCNGCTWKTGTRDQKFKVTLSNAGSSQPGLQRILSFREIRSLAVPSLLHPRKQARTEGLIWAWLARLPTRSGNPEWGSPRHICVYCIFILETESHSAAQLASKAWSSCLRFSNAGIRDVCLQTWSEFSSHYGSQGVHAKAAGPRHTVRGNTPLPVPTIVPLAHCVF